jgi:hypothetical protein
MNALIGLEITTTDIGYTILLPDEGTGRLLDANRVENMSDVIRAISAQGIDLMHCTVACAPDQKAVVEDLLSAGLWRPPIVVAKQSQNRKMRRAHEAAARRKLN